MVIQILQSAIFSPVNFFGFTRLAGKNGQAGGGKRTAENEPQSSCGSRRRRFQRGKNLPIINFLVNNL
jgi:hypothetical protein